MRTLLLTTGLLTILACSTRDSKTSDKEQEQEQDTIITNVNRGVGDSLLLTNSITHHFSSPTALDTFQIRLTGKTIVDGNVEFEIVSSNGIVILHEKIPS